MVAFAAIFTWLAPVLLAPAFNRFDELPAGKTRSQILRLGERAGVEIGNVYRVDASRRTTGLNAYVTGLGSTKRVVIYDNTLRELDAGELDSLVAHELGHVKGDDILRGIAWVALVAPLGVLFVQLASGALARRSGDDPRSPAALPALALSMALALLVLGSVSAQLSRRVEARADSFALEQTGDPQALIGLQQRLAVTNVADPDPPAALAVALRHPSRHDAADRRRGGLRARAAVKTVLLTVGKAQEPFRRCRRPLPQAARPLPAADRDRGSRRR